MRYEFKVAPGGLRNGQVMNVLREVFGRARIDKWANYNGYLTIECTGDQFAHYMTLCVQEGLVSSHSNTYMQVKRFAPAPAPAREIFA